MGDIMKKIWIYLLSVAFSLVFGASYFYIFTYNLNIEDQKVSTPISDKSYTLYYNQLGVYKNADAMLTKVLELKNNNIDVYVYKINELNYFVSDFSFDKNITQNKALTLELYGYSTILKERIVNQEIKELVEKNEIDAAIQAMNSN